MEAFVKKVKIPPGKRLIFVASITLKNGKRIFARNYGKKAFAILVDA